MLCWPNSRERSGRQRQGQQDEEHRLGPSPAVQTVTSCCPCRRPSFSRRKLAATYSQAGPAGQTPKGAEASRVFTPLPPRRASGSHTRTHMYTHMCTHVGHSAGGHPRLLATTTQESNTRSEDHVLKHHNKPFATSQKAGYNTCSNTALLPLPNLDCESHSLSPLTPTFPVSHVGTSGATVMLPSAFCISRLFFAECSAGPRPSLMSTCRPPAPWALQGRWLG